MQNLNEEENKLELNSSGIIITNHMENIITVEEDEMGFEDNNIKLQVHSLKFNYNDQYLAAGYNDGRVRIFNVKTRKLTCEKDCNLNKNFASLVQCIKWRPPIDGRTNNILMAICHNRVLEIHTPSQKIVNQTTMMDIIFSCEYSHDGLMYALGLNDLSVRVYDSLTKKEIIKLGGFDNQKVAGHQNKIFGLKFVRDQKALISGSWDKILIIWDLTSKSL